MKTIKTLLIIKAMEPKQCTNLWPVDLIKPMIDNPLIGRDEYGIRHVGNYVQKALDDVNQRLAGGNWKWNPVTPENIHVGMRVRPGKDWQYGNQNSGCDGIITDAKLKHEWCKVEWDNGDKYHYRYKNEHDLDIVNSNINLKTSKNGNKSIKVQGRASKIRKGIRRIYGGLQSRNGGTIS